MFIKGEDMCVLETCYSHLTFIVGLTIGSTAGLLVGTVVRKRRQGSIILMLLNLFTKGSLRNGGILATRHAASRYHETDFFQDMRHLC